MVNQIKKSHFFPLLGIILTTTVWLISRPVKGQDILFIKNLKDQEIQQKFLGHLNLNKYSDNLSNLNNSYFKVSTSKLPKTFYTAQLEKSSSNKFKDINLSETFISQETIRSEINKQEILEEEPRILVVEVIVKGANEELENLIYNILQTKPGRTTTRSELQQDVNAIYATGYFANVQVTPTDTPLGVRITYAVKVNPVLKQVVVNTVPDIKDQRALLPETVQKIFGQQYNKTLNLRDLQKGIKKINEWYAEQGFDLAQVIGSPAVSDDGVITLIIAEGVIENIKVRFFNAEDEPVDVELVTL